MTKNEGCVNKLKDLKLKEFDAVGYVYMVGKKGNQGKSNIDYFDLSGEMGTQDQWTSLLGSYDKGLDVSSPNLGSTLETITDESLDQIELKIATKVVLFERKLSKLTPTKSDRPKTQDQKPQSTTKSNNWKNL